MLLITCNEQGSRLCVFRSELLFSLIGFFFSCRPPASHPLFALFRALFNPPGSPFWVMFFLGKKKKKRLWTLSHSFVLFYASSYCTSLGTPVVATTKELCTTTKVFVPCLLSLEVKCIFLHSGLLLSKIYFIKQTFVIQECVVFTCGPVSNEINHFHLISLCTDSYLTLPSARGPALPSARAGGEGGHVGTRFLPAHHINLPGAFPKTQTQPRAPDAGKHSPPFGEKKIRKEKKKGSGQNLFPWPRRAAGRRAGARAAGSARRCGQALPASLPRAARAAPPLRPPAAGAGGGPQEPARGAACSLGAFSSPCKSPRVHGWLSSGPAMLQHIGLRCSRSCSVLWLRAELAVSVSAAVRGHGSLSAFCFWPYPFEFSG